MVLQEPIAVIGFDLMFPGDASTPAGFAELLAKGRSAHGEVPKDRYDVDSFYHPDASRAGSVSISLTQTLGIFFCAEMSVNIISDECANRPFPERRRIEI